MDKEKKSEIHITNNFNAPIGQHIDHVDTINFRMDGDGNFHFGMVENVQREKDEVDAPLSQELQTNRARGLLNAAVEQDLLRDDYQPSESIKKWQLALLADAIAGELALKSKWKIFGRLWGIPSESLRSEATRYKNPEEEKKFQKILRRIIG